MATQTIKHGLFSYTGAGGKEMTATANQTVDIPNSPDVTRGQAAGAFWPGSVGVTPVEEANKYRKALGLPEPGFMGGVENLPVS